MKTSRRRLVILILCIFAGGTGLASAQVKASYMYNLSTFTGTVPYSWPTVSVDKARTEIYVIYQNNIRVFNEYGMEIYRFGDDLDVGQVLDGAVDRNGDIFLLTFKSPESAVVHCNYRGEPLSTWSLNGLPEKFSGFVPTRMVIQNDSFYLVSPGQMKVAIADSEGHFKKGYDLFSMLELEEKDRESTELSGFSVDRDGSILFTVAVLFKAYRLSPDGQLNWFGRAGSSPGRFNVVAGIVRDSKGNYLVADKLKCAIMVFDKKFDFITQFGYRGGRPENLIVPNELAIDNQDRIYVTQTRRRGVSVFRLIYS